jgi:hypothetical protein
MIVEYNGILYKVFLHPNGESEHDELYQDRSDGSADQIPLDLIDFNKIFIISSCQKDSMKIFELAAHSSCGTYFASYLKSVTVIADSKEAAMKKYEEWSVSNEGHSFEKGNLKNLEITELSMNSYRILTYDHDSDSLF